MAANSFGRHFRVSTFGESHGSAMGCVIDGCPSGLVFYTELLRKNLERRRPGKHSDKVNLQSDRKEEDLPQVLSGVFEGKTLGTPIAMLTFNKDQRSSDYSEIKTSARPGHADDTWKEKYLHTDHRGGGRSSARETVARVMAGSVAQMLVSTWAPDVRVKAFVSQIGEYQISETARESFLEKDLDLFSYYEYLDSFSARFPDSEKKDLIENLLLEGKKEGRSYGGYMDVVIENPPKALGQAVFNKFKSELAGAMLSIGACNSFELGEASKVNCSEGSEIHQMQDFEGEVYGGIRGGFTTGEKLRFRLGFKPTSSVLSVAQKGRHDPCILPRAVSVVESMVFLLLADHMLWNRLDQI